MSKGGKPAEGKNVLGMVDTRIKYIPYNRVGGRGRVVWTGLALSYTLLQDFGTICRVEVGDARDVPPKKERSSFLPRKRAVRQDEMRQNERARIT